MAFHFSYVICAAACLIFSCLLSPSITSQIPIFAMLKFKSIYNIPAIIDVPEKDEVPSQISVGISLSISYGTIAILQPDRSTHTLKIEGDDAYREVMSRLSLASSKHLAYVNM
jgi:hypothetical protein